MSELSKRGALLIGDAAMAPPPLGSLRQRARRYRLRRRLQAGVAAVAAIAAAAGGFGWASAGGTPAPQARASGGPLQALPAPATARVAAGPAHPPGRPGTWRLASYLSEPLSWSRGNGGPPAGGELSCPQPGTCYVVGPAGGGSSSGPGLPLSILYVSGDGGLSWTAIRMPGDASFTTALACPAAGDCLAGGEVAGQAVLLSSGDGGYRWSYRSLPAGDGVIGQLDCPTATSCRALASATSEVSAAGQAPGPTWFLSTDDAGARWKAYSFPMGFTTSAAISALSCLSASDCVVIGQGTGRGNLMGDPPGVVLRTGDGGHTWATASLPQPMTFVQFGSGPAALTCAGTSSCYALGFAPQRYIPPPPVKLSGGGTGTSQICSSMTKSGRCVPPKYEEEGAAAVSTDGGATWRMLALPPRTTDPELDAISCVSAAVCWIAGGQDGSAMILATRDGGATWAKTTFAAGPPAPGQQADSLWDAGEISCPSVSYCVAMGVADQGSYHTPIYTNVGG